jgi:uncharacterized surface protein with fasciclin (FAS1) repeats
MKPYVSLLAVAALLVLMIGCQADYEDPDALVRDTVVVNEDDGILGENLFATLEADGRFSTLTTAIDSAGLRSTFEGPGPFTVFAPTDDAFGGIEDGGVEDLLQPANRDQLRDLLMQHVINGRQQSSDLRTTDRVESMYGSDLRVTGRNDDLRISDAEIVEADISASNGVIHAINSVLTPPDAI